MTRLRVAAATATTALMLGGALVVAPSAAAADHSPAKSPTTADETVHVRHGCFVGSYTDTPSSTTLYYKNRCKHRHKLKVDWVGPVTSDYPLVKGGSKGHVKSYWGISPRIEDLGRR